MEKISFTREELYQLVWSEPLSRLAKKYNISDNGLRKICKRYDIPLPISGYWQRIQYGHKVSKSTLPGNSKDLGNITLCYRDKDGNYVDIEKTPKSKLKDEFCNNSKLPLKVSERLSNPDPLVVQAQSSLLLKKNEHYHYNGVVETKSGELKIRVAPSNIPRALRFMDAFIKLLYARNHEFDKSYSQVHGLIYGVSFEFSLREKYTVTEVQGNYPSKVYTSLGKFVFSSGPLGTKDWSDSKQLIEEKLADIMIYIEMKCKELSDYWAENERQRQIELEADRKRKELQARKQTELNAIEDLLNQAIRWQQARFMREYLAVVIQNTENNMNSESIDWINWAKHKIDWYDPLIQAPDELLDNLDRQKLVGMVNEKNLNPTKNSSYS